MSTILVSGVSGIIGYGILKSLRKSHPGCRLIGTTVYPRNAGIPFCDAFEVAPLTDHESYVSWLLEMIRRWDVSILIPGIESDVFAWNEHRETITADGAVVVLNDAELIRLCSDKWNFYQRLFEHKSGYAIPTALAYDEKLGNFPLLAKPRKGSGSKGISILDGMKSLNEHLANHDSAMIYQPVIGSVEDEYTCSAFFDWESRLCAFMTMRRRLSQAGFTETAAVVELPGIPEALTRLAEIFRPIGPTNFQFRLDHEEIKLLEINPRISSATSIRTAFGYNESAMAVDFFLNGIVPKQPKITYGHAVRYIEDMIFYDSDNI